MADTQTTVLTLDIQLLDEKRADATLIKLDNPVNNITREMVSTAFQPVLSAGWFLTTKGGIVKYLGDITINQSIKTKLGGEDFYITPNHFNRDIAIDEVQNFVINCTGATIQGVNIDNFTNTFEEEHPEDYVQVYAPVIAANGLSVTIPVLGKGTTSPDTISFDANVIVLGTTVTVPITVKIG